MQRLWFPLFIFFTIVGLVLALAWLAYQELYVGKQEKMLKVDYLDVGQGDAALIESPSGIQILIDGGRDGKVLSELVPAMGYFDRTIDMVIATHPDADHIGGLIDVMKRYKVKSVLMTDNANDTPASEAFLAMLEKEHAEIIMAHRGETFDLGVGSSGSTTLRVLFPDRPVTNVESNLSSIIVKLSYGDADFLFTGDSPKSIETYLVTLDGTELESEILKVGHHGSRTSTDPLFVEAVHPTYAIISAGKDNDYGHPHKEVLEILEDAGAITKNTADVGSISFTTDGHSIWLK